MTYYIGTIVIYCWWHCNLLLYVAICCYMLEFKFRINKNNIQQQITVNNSSNQRNKYNYNKQQHIATYFSIQKIRTVEFNSYLIRNEKFGATPLFSVNLDPIIQNSSTDLFKLVTSQRKSQTFGDFGLQKSIVNSRRLRALMGFKSIFRLAIDVWIVIIK